MIIFVKPLKIKQNIPNFLTCCNLLCGCLAIVCAFEGNLVWSAYLVGIAAVFDFFDGFAARMLGVSSPIGKDLDSLADMVTFGVVPGVIMFQFLRFSLIGNYVIYPPLSALTNEIDYQNSQFLLAYIAFCIPVFSAVRLAKFNNDTRQSESFIGLPTPANAILICSFPLIVFYSSGTDFSLIMLKELISNNSDSSPLSSIFVGGKSIIMSGVQDNSSGFYVPTFISGMLSNHFFLMGFSLFLSFLLVAPLPLFALKFKSFGWKGNEIRYVFLGLSVVLLVTLKFIGIPLVIVLYILLSVVNNLLKGRNSLSS